MEKYVQDSMRYPEKEKTNLQEAIVKVRFDVSKDGKLLKPECELVYGTSSVFKDEALRLVLGMPSWTPAKKNGRPVADYGYDIEVHFTLPDSLIYVHPLSSDTTVYSSNEVDSVAVYRGGDYSMTQLLKSNIRYPQMEKEKGIMGTVYVSYIVEKDGMVSGVRIEEAIPNAPGLSKESLRVVSMFPRHLPAVKNGQTVRYRKTIPVRFILM